MRTLEPTDLLSLWEQGYRLHPLDRGLLVLGAALPGVSYDTVADWPLGRRNAMLAAVRCACFGPRLGGWAGCEQCGEKLEFDVDGRMLAEGVEDEDGYGSEPVRVGDRSFRLPSTRDLARVVHEDDAAVAGLRLAEMCRVGPGDPMSDDELDVVGERLADADPMAEILLAMLCPVCGYEGNATLDLVSFFWSEVEVRAKRLLLDVHQLAMAYGWSEGEILALSEPRRAFYLDRVQA